MADYDNTNSGFIGKNPNKKKDSHPDLKGSINIEGMEYWLSAWKNSKGYGMKFTKKDDQPSHKYRDPEPAPRYPQTAPKPSSDASRSRYPAERQAPRRDDDFDDASVPF
jgi:hypothetical protein